MFAVIAVTAIFGGILALFVAGVLAILFVAAMGAASIMAIFIGIGAAIASLITVAVIIAALETLLMSLIMEIVPARFVASIIRELSEIMWRFFGDGRIATKFLLSTA